MYERKDRQQNIHSVNQIFEDMILERSRFQADNFYYHHFDIVLSTIFRENMLCTSCAKQLIHRNAQAYFLLNQTNIQES